MEQNTEYGDEHTRTNTDQVDSNMDKNERYIGETAPEEERAEGDEETGGEPTGPPKGAGKQSSFLMSTSWLHLSL